MALKNKIDYEALGLRCGLELHQQLKTNRKLFCHCKAELSQEDNLQAVIVRYMRPTLSELGEYDRAALQEFRKKRKIIYEVPHSVCTYEIDETPPCEPDPEAIDLAITIARMLRMSVFDELHVNRKQYLDGSVPSGFQRTMIVGVNGQAEIQNKTIPLAMLALEEDSCREIQSNKRAITWRVDRLGIPLVEIATKTFSIKNPGEIKLIAEAIGRILRATGKVKRGIGTIRQDLNVSIAKGARVEIKGVQKLELLPLFVQLEVERQLALLEIKEELEKRALTPAMFTSDSWKDCQSIFAKTSSAFLQKAMKRRLKIYGVKLPGLEGLLGKQVQLERSFGKELADRVKVLTGLRGILHTDELPKLGITAEEVQQLKDYFKCSVKDAVVLVIGKKAQVLAALEEIIIRIKEAFAGVPTETRQAVADGTTVFRRYLGGASRLYPDTDTPLIVITEERFKKIDASLPELPEERLQRYVSDLQLPREIAYQLTISPHVQLFEQLVALEVDPVLAAVTLEQTVKALAREGFPIENLTDEVILEIFTYYKEGKIAKDAIEPLLRHYSKNPKEYLESAIKKLDLEQLTEEELEKIIQVVLEENKAIIEAQKQQALGALMGEIMARVRGKANGKIVNKKLLALLEKSLSR